VVLQKGLPRRGRRPLRSDTIRLHRRFGHVNAQLAQLANNAWCAPGRIGLPHRADEIVDILGNRRTAGLALLAQSPPVIAKALALPGEDRAGLDKSECLLPTHPEAREAGPEQTIRRLEPRSVNCPLIDGHLMPQGHVLQPEGFPRAEHGQDIG
jgi:hypothetical protein